jgi:hypothetical protein
MAVGNIFCFFRLKGVNIIAQGEALGGRIELVGSPVRAIQIVTPLQGFEIINTVSRGVAPGWYVSARWAGIKTSNAMVRFSL